MVVLWLRFVLAIALVGVAGSPAGGEPGGRVESTLAVIEGQPAVVEAGALRPSLIDATWRERDTVLAERVEKTRLLAHALGAPNVEGPARWLIQDRSSRSGQEAMQRALHARRLAPDLPVAHLAIADAALQSGLVLLSLRSLVEALSAIPRHLEARLWIEGVLGVVLAGGLILGSLFFVFLAGLRSLPAAVHDLGDWTWPAMPTFSRAAVLAAFAGLPLVFGEGWLGLAAVFFGVGFLYANRKSRVALACAALLFGFGLYGVSERTGRVLRGLDGDGVELAAYAVTREMDSTRDRALLQASAGSDLMAAHAVALGARREGDAMAAITAYEALLSRFPGDASALANLGNLYFEAGEIQKAIALYQRSVAREPSAIVLFNLSQAHARAFQVADFDRVMARAQQLDPGGIEELSRSARDGLVFDVPLGADRIYEQLIATSDGFSLVRAARERFAPGWLGSRWQNGLLVFAALALLAILAGRRFEASSRCRSCGSRICPRCDGEVRHEVCNACHGLFHLPEDTDPRLRAQRIAHLEGRERRQQWMHNALGMLVPGWEGLASGSPLGGLVACLLLSAALLALAFAWTSLPDPFVLGSVGSLALIVAVVLGLLGYTGLVLATRLRRDRTSS